MQSNEVVERLRAWAGPGVIDAYVPIQQSQLALIADFIEGQASKLGACVGALENLLPGLILDLRYAEPDDDRDAMQSRIKTVTDALEATK